MLYGISNRTLLFTVKQQRIVCTWNIHFINTYLSDLKAPVPEWLMIQFILLIKYVNSKLRQEPVHCTLLSDMTLFKRMSSYPFLVLSPHPPLPSFICTSILIYISLMSPDIVLTIIPIPVREEVKYQQSYVRYKRENVNRTCFSNWKLHLVIERMSQCSHINIKQHLVAR